MAESKSKAKAEGKKKLSPQEFHVKQLDDRLKRLQHKLEHRVPHFSEEQRDQARDRTERDIASLRKLIAKARHE